MKSARKAGSRALAWSFDAALGLRGLGGDEANAEGRGAAVFEPGEQTGIELNELAHGGGARATAAMLWSAAPTGGGATERQADAAHGGPAHGQGVEVLQLLGEVHIVEAGVGRGHE